MNIQETYRKIYTPAHAYIGCLWVFCGEVRGTVSQAGREGGKELRRDNEGRDGGLAVNKDASQLDFHKPLAILHAENLFNERNKTEVKMSVQVVVGGIDDFEGGDGRRRRGGMGR